MVQQQAKVDDFQIIDETTPAQIAIEEKVMAGEPVPQEETPPAEPAVAAAPPVAAPPVAPPKPPTPPEQPPAPAPRTYSEEQVRQMQSSWDRQIAQERQRAQTASKQLQEFDLNASVEAHLRTQERQLETSIGADEARKVVRTPDNERQVREGISAQQRVRVLEEQASAAQNEQEFNARVVTARLFTQQYGVAADDAELLLSAQTPVQMERLAKNLGSTGKATTEAAKSLREQVPVETPQTKLESGMSGTGAPESLERMGERLNSVPSWEWTEREREFMRTGRVK